MPIFPKILRTKIIPPRRAPRTLSRPRVSQRLADAQHYRLTLLQAGAGYGKSTALAELTTEMQPLIWYQVTQEDSDPLVFLLYLCHATQLSLPGLDGLPTAFLESWDGSQGPLPWRSLLDGYLNALSEGLTAPTLLVMDDIHLVLESGEVAQIMDRLIGLAPAALHVLLAGRPPIQLPNLARWRLQGDVLLLDQTALTFTGPETAALFAQQYGYELTSDEVDVLLDYTEGWAIALQLTWQNLRSRSATALNFSAYLQMDSLDALFEVLARDVFAQQSADIREFLLITATLRELIPEACDAVRSCSLQSLRIDPERKPVGTGSEVRDSTAMLAYLRRQDLFVVETSEGILRYHHIFHEFLRQQASKEQRQAWHASAAVYFLTRQDHENAIYHYRWAEAWSDVAAQLAEFGGQLLASGRLEALASQLDALPPETLSAQPLLLFYMGDLARLYSRFQEALGWYQQAEAVWRSHGQSGGVARALRGQARVYLDTVNPSKAEELLQQSVFLSDGFEDREAQVRLYELLAENKLNAGRVEEAERLRQKADDLRSEGPSNEQLLFRVLLRTGRIGEARQALEARAAAERRAPVQTPRAHRETLLLLSLIYSFQGEGELAYQAALEGTQRGEELKSPFITAVGYMRQGHALMAQAAFTDQRFANYANARLQFEKCVQISRSLSVPRLLVEANWGLCRAYGYLGELPQAQQYALDAIEIAAQAGDEWIASLVRLALGASLVLAGRYEAAETWLSRAFTGFQECSDVFGRNAARLWLCLSWQRQKRHQRLEPVLPEVLAACRERGYDFLWIRPSLLGAPDERIFVPLLALARQHGWEAGYVTRLLGVMGLTDVSLHPGYQLRVSTLGSFQVWRGDDLVPASGWRREKARHLFQLLLTFRHTPLERDQICEHLWPGADASTVQRNFKITLNTLYQVLEPERKPGAESAFILREGTGYGLRSEADIWLDVEQFERLVRQAERPESPRPDDRRLETLRAALKLYQGEYLPETLYETWAAQERERMAVMFLEAADRLSDLLLHAGQYSEVVELGQRILAQDNCWERAYRHLMQAYAHLGDRGQVGRTYQRCVQTLRAELDLAPSAETQALYDQLAN